MSRQKSAKVGYYGDIGAEPPAARGWRVGGNAPNRRRPREKAPALWNFAILLCKNNLILDYFSKN